MKPVFTFFISIFLVTVLSAQENGGPYMPDNNTALLMHFDGNAANSASVGYNGIVHGSGISYDNDGVHGQCLRLDNSTWDKQSWIEVPFYDELNVSSDGLSVECWFKFNSWGETTSGTRNLFRKDGASWPADYEIIIWPDVNGGRQGQVNMDCEDEETRNWGADAPIADILELNTWYYIVIYYNPGFKHEYVNEKGEQRQASSVYCLIRDENFEEIFASRGHTETLPTNSNGLFRLGFGGSGNSYFDGWIDELRISNSYRKYRDDVLAKVDINALPDSVFIPLKDRWTVYQWPLAEYYPYNPEKGDIERANACGPTMLTRGIHYWEYPRFPKGIIEHHWVGLDWYANYDETEYLWDQMPPVFYDGATVEDYGPAATLSAQVGVASRKTYDNMYCMPKFLKENFLFSKKTRLVCEEEYTKEEWENIIRNELSHGRICLVGGWGHYYIINGYNSQNQFFTDYSFNDNYWNDIKGFDYGAMQDMIIYMEPDWGNKALELEQPKSGNLYQMGSELEIQWDAENISKLIIEYSSDAGYNWHTVADNVDAITGSYSWTIPDALSDDYRIRISDKDNLNVYRKSSGINVYKQKEFAFDYPIRNTKFLKGTEQTVYWQSSGIEIIKLEYSTDNSIWHLLNENVKVTEGNFSVQLPDVLSENITLRATDLSENGSNYSSESFQLVEDHLWGGPYEADNETVLLMHFENDISNSSNNALLPNETTPIGYYEANFENNLGKAFRNINGDIIGNAILVKNSENIDLGNDWTMEAWVNVSNIMGERTVASLIINKWEAFNIGAGWQHFGASVNFENGTEVGFGNPEEYQLDKWYHVALISDASSEKIYFYVHDENLNQIYKEAKSFPEGSNGLIKSNEYLLTLGGLGGGSNFELDGYLDEMRIVKRSELSEYIKSELVELPFTDDFSQNYQNWTTFSVTGDDVWHISNDDGIDFGKCARFYKTSNPGQQNDDWLISPVFNTTEISNLAITFKYSYAFEGAAPDFYYASTYDGDPTNSTWTKIDKEFWISNWGWQDARIEIANPGESLVFAVRYQVSPNDEYYFLMDNFSIEAYEPVVFNKVGNSEHFDFYTNIEGEEDYYYNIQDELEKEYSKLSAYWDRPFREKIFDEDVRIKVNFGSKEDIYLCDDKTPNWKCGFHNISTFEIYLSPLTTDIQRSFYTDLKGLAVNEFSQLAIIRKLQRNQIGNFPEYFLEGFGLYETGFRPRVDSVRAYMDGRINPEMSFIEDTTGIATTNKKDVTVSFIEGQLMFGYFNLKPWEDGWFNFVHYFYVNADEERYRCINTSEHFNLYTFPADSVYSQEILDSLEGSFSRYTALYELQINHQWSVVLHSKKSVALDFGYSENTAGSAFGGSAFSVLLIERNPGIFFDDDGKMGIINHEFFHTIANHFNIFNGFYNEGLTTVMSGRPFTEDKLSIHKAIIQNVFDFYEVNYGRYPTMDEFVYDPHRDIDGFKGFDPYVFGSAFFYYIFESYNYLDVKKFILGEGDIEGDYEGAFHKTKEEIEAGYIAYLENIINPTISKPGVVTLSVSQIQAYSAILNGSISSDGGATITQRGFYWSNSNPNPGLGDHVETESGTTGEFSFELTGLSSGTNYYFRAFATNSEGTAFGEVKQFTTLEEATALEELPFSDDFSQNYENWTTVSVTGDDVWHISNDDGIDFGKCARFYPTSNPRQANNDWLVSPVFNTNGMNNLAVTFKYLFTADGASPEFYYAAAFDGNPANSNWIHIDKSFWINDWGWQDARIEIANPGESFVFALRYEVSPDDQYYFLMDNFHIEGITHNQPAIETNNATSITSNSATLNGKLISDGGATITQRGFYWSSSNSNPGSGDHVENVNGTTGEFLFELTDLSAGTTYFYKAFATNIAGTSTGVVMEFTTNDEQAALIALPFTDPFEDDYLNWTPYSLAGEEIWHISPDDGMEGSRCARFYITSNPKQANVDWLISDYFNVAGLNLLEVRFDYFWHTPGRQPEFFYTHDFTGNIEFTNWNHLENNFWSQGKSQWAEAVLEIDNEASQLAFAMQYSSTTEGGQYVLIDNFSIREKGTGVKVYPNQSEEIRVFPNPVSEQTRLEFFLEGADMVTLELYNTNGSKQLVISEQFYHEGWHKLPIGHYFSKPGLYFAKLSSSEWMHTIKLLVQE